MRLRLGRRGFSVIREPQVAMLSTVGKTPHIEGSSGGSGSLPLPQIPALSTFRTKLLEGCVVLGRTSFPGGDVNTVNANRSGGTYSYQRKASTAYLVGEHIYDALNAHECTTAGTTSSGGAPSFSTTLGGTTSDGSVVWTCIEKINASPPWSYALSGQGIGSGLRYDNTTSWQQNAGSDGYWHGNARYADGGGALCVSYYDAGDTLWRAKDYVSRTGIAGYGGQSNADYQKRLETYAGYWMDNFAGCKLRENWGDPQNPPWWWFPDGLVQDYQRASGRYKRPAYIIASNIQGLANNHFWANPAGGPWTSRTDLYSMYKHAVTRENAYFVTNQVMSRTVGNAYKSATIDGATAEMLRWAVSNIAEHIQQGMSDYRQPTEGETYAMQPFFLALAVRAICDYYDLEVASGRDPERHFNPAAPSGGGSAWSWTWSKSGTHGFPGTGVTPCRAWPNIPAMIEDYHDWLWNRSGLRGTNGSGRQSFNYSTANGEKTNDLCAMLGWGFGWIGKFRLLNGNSTTSITPAGWFDMADQLFETNVLDGYYDPTRISCPFFTGKQYNELMRFAMRYIDIRNSVSGRND